MAGFLADECVWRSLVECLRENGREVRSIAEESSSIDDASVLSISMKEGLVLITEDKDFGQLVFERGQAAFAIVVVQFARFGGSRPEVARSIAARIVGMEKNLTGMLTTVEPERTRQRRLPS